MEHSNILLESWPPVCNIQEVVEETKQNCYLLFVTLSGYGQCVCEELLDMQYERSAKGA